MSSSQLPSEAKDQKKRERIENTVSWVEDRLIVWRNGIRRRDVLAAHYSKDQYASACELKDKDTEPLEAANRSQPAVKLDRGGLTLISERGMMGSSMILIVIINLYCLASNPQID